MVDKVHNLCAYECKGFVSLLEALLHLWNLNLIVVTIYSVVTGTVHQGSSACKWVRIQTMATPASITSFGPC
jgi:hypothetical protein